MTASKDTLFPELRSFWQRIAKPDTQDGCWIWTGGKTTAGYGIWSRGRGRHRPYAHRVAWELANGPIADGMNVLHRCDNPSCVRPDHLFIGTDADNVADKVAKGRHLRGEDCPWTQPTDEQVAEIRNLYASGGIRQRDIARRYGVDPSHVSNIVRRKARR